MLQMQRKPLLQSVFRLEAKGSEAQGLSRSHDLALRTSLLSSRGGASRGNLSCTPSVAPPQSIFCTPFVPHSCTPGVQRGTSGVQVTGKISIASASMYPLGYVQSQSPRGCGLRLYAQGPNSVQHNSVLGQPIL